MADVLVPIGFLTSVLHIYTVHSPLQGHHRLLGIENSGEQ